MGRPSGPGLETTQHFQKIVLRVRGKSVSSRVDADAGAAWDIVIETHVRRLRLVELHVPIAVRWYFLAQLLSQAHLGESRAVRRKRPGGESSCTWRTKARRGVQRQCRPSYLSAESVSFRTIFFFLTYSQKFSTSRRLLTNFSIPSNS